jgi:hypothetical protein
MSSKRVGPAGIQPSNSRVRALDAVTSRPNKRPIQPKWASAFSGATDTGGDAQVVADRGGDVAGGETALGHCVDARTCRGLLQRQPHHARCVGPADGGPAAGAVADEAGGAVGSCDPRQRRSEAVVAQAMHRGREAQRHGPYAAIGVSQGKVLAPAAHRVGTVVRRRVVLGQRSSHDACRQPGGEQERAVAALEGVEHPLDGGALGAAGAGIVGEVVVEGEVDDAVRGCRCRRQAVEVVEGAAVDGGATLLSVTRVVTRTGVDRSKRSNSSAIGCKHSRR